MSENFLQEKKVGSTDHEQKKWQDGKCKRTTQKNKSEQERGIKWQPWDSRQEVTSATTSLPSVKCKTTGSSGKVLSLVCCHDNTHRTLPDYYCQHTAMPFQNPHSTVSWKQVDLEEKRFSFHSFFVCLLPTHRLCVYVGLGWEANHLSSWLLLTTQSESWHT